MRFRFFFFPSFLSLFFLFFFALHSLSSSRLDFKTTTKKTLIRQGRATYENGGVYEGAFSKGVRCGWGRHTFPAPVAAAAAAAAASSSSNSSASSASPPPPRPTYEGEWLDDAPHGQGVHFCPVGGTFVGSWERGSRSKGCWTSADGEEEYEGDWAVVADAVDAAAVVDGADDADDA